MLSIAKHTRQFFAMALVLSGGLALWNCAEEAPPPPPPTFRADTLEGGVISIANTGMPSWTPASTWTAVEELRIGVLAEREGPEQFSSIYSLAVDGEGMVYILEQQAQEIRVFRPDGTFSHLIGQLGEGPGQLRGAMGMKLTPDLRILTYDIHNARYSIFERDGTYVIGYPLTIRGGWLMGSWGAGFDRQGRLIDWGVRRPNEPGAVNDAHMTYFPIRLSRDFAQHDTLAPIDWYFQTTGGVPIPHGGGVATFVDRQAGLWFGHTREYRIFRRTMEGDTTLVFTLPASPVEITAEEKDSLVTAWGALGEEYEIQAGDIPDTKPVLRRILGDNNGHIFVFPHLEGVPSGSAVDVFMETGVYLGRVTLPELLQLSPNPVFRGQYLYGVVLGEFDIPYVVRYRIGRGVGTRWP